MAVFDRDGFACRRCGTPTWYYGRPTRYREANGAPHLCMEPLGGVGEHDWPNIERLLGMSTPVAPKHRLPRMQLPE